jgi:O-methyltransferase involved in polyketide biosynthesis
MTDKVHLALGDVQQTLLLPLWGRAVETQKAAPLLIDRATAEIVQRIDYDFAAATQHLSTISQLGWIARRCIFYQQKCDFSMTWVTA